MKGKRILENEKETKKVKKNNVNIKKGLKKLKIVMFLTMLVLIYFTSPHITQLIKNGAMELYRLDNDIITRIVELVLAVLLVFIATFKKEK